MRFVIFGIFALGWFGVWWWTYTCHIKGACCQQEVVYSGVDESDGVVHSDKTGEDLIREAGPLEFARGSSEPLLSPHFNNWIDSLHSELREGDSLLITGLAFTDEIAGTDIMNLASDRALAVERLLGQELPSNPVGVDSMSDGNYPVASDLPYPAFEIRIARRPARVEKLEDRVLIYFPFNSTERLTDAEIDAYLEDLAGYLGGNDAHVELTGHSDAYGPEEANYTLALWRAQAIADQLVEKGVPAGRVEVKSKGETEPISPNDTPSNAARNRRVEVVLIEK